MHFVINAKSSIQFLRNSKEFSKIKYENKFMKMAVEVKNMKIALATQLNGKNSVRPSI